MLNIVKQLIIHPKVKSVLCLFTALFIIMIVLSYDGNDPAINIATDMIPKNWGGYAGANISKALIMICGMSIVLVPIFLLSWSYRYYIRNEVTYFNFRLIASFTSLFCFSYLISNVEALDLKLKGMVGVTLYNMIRNYDSDIILIINIIVFFISIISCMFAMNYSLQDLKSALMKLINNICSLSKVIYTSLRNKYATINSDSKITTDSVTSTANTIPTASNNYSSRKQSEDSEITLSPDLILSKKRCADNSDSSEKYNQDKISHAKLAIPALPTIDLLYKNNRSNSYQESESQLANNADQLLKILNDFGIKGQVLNINQGPVVTLYEFAPAAGTKSSRVIGLSDDIARSLSALSTRISTIPGKNALGIELPNKQRLFFNIRELIETTEYQTSKRMLPIILGKDLNGNPEIVDLTKMPHLLIAGTTGSGKSVAVNAMIISLLYRLSPSECKFIMIDPKMLELSVYDGIPHLLTPVVIDPHKAVFALKWAVKEMENRYRLMSNLGVRNIQGFNSRIDEAITNGETLEKTLQTGFDPESGKPIYESLPITLEKLPFIVVIVDEMADLMIVAGKDIESLIQRLAQMARAAGIHIIMATQRPSVDVITGVIKANFPSRISFKVTSKIDSRTILGEMGAEQLLGMGDMLYMGNGLAIKRVHAPFVDDTEVEQVANFWRSKEQPQYISTITEDSSETSDSTNITADGSNDDRLYQEAINIIKSDKKVSTSYIQRCLRIGYNRAALIIERMEKERIISPPNHNGKRDILIDY